MNFPESHHVLNSKYFSESHFLCSPNGKEFGIGIGLGNLSPPRIGAIVTFKYQELTLGGVPRFPSFLRVRNDITWEEVCKNAKDKQEHVSQNKQEAEKPIFALPTHIESTGITATLPASPPVPQSPQNVQSQAQDTTAPTTSQTEKKTESQKQ